MSLRKNFSQILSDTIQTEENKYYKRKTLNNFGLNINDYKNRCKESNLNKVDKNYYIDYIDKIQKTPNKNNIGYNTEKTDYSSHINDRLSKIQTNSEKRPIYFYVNLNESNNNEQNKTHTLNILTGAKNIFHRTDVNLKSVPHKTSLHCFRKSNHYYKVNKFDMENIINFSNTLKNYITPKTRKLKYLFHNNSSQKKKQKLNNRFNSLNCFIDNYVQIDENKIVNRYIPNFKDYFSNTDYSLLSQKRKNLLTENEKIKNEKRMKLDSLNKKIREIKKEINI